MLNIPNINEFKGVDMSSVSAVRKDMVDTSSVSLQQQSAGIVQDRNSISEISRYLSESKIDINSSEASYDGKDLDFNLTFRKNSNEYINATGYYSSTTEEFNFSMSMKFKRFVIENGLMKEKPFEASINFNSSDMKSVAVEQSAQKEDVYKFLSRILSKIFELADNKTQKLNGVIFKVEDLIDLAQIGDTKTAKMVKEMINIAIFTAQLKQMMKERSKNQESVTLVAQRQMEETTSKSTSSVNITDFSIKISEASDSGSGKTSAGSAGGK